MAGERGGFGPEARGNDRSEGMGCSREEAIPRALRSLETYAHSLVRPEFQARFTGADIVQEAFLAVRHRMERVRRLQDAHRRRWLKAALRCTARNLHRPGSRGKRYVATFTSLGADPAVPGPNAEPLDALLMREENDRRLEVISELPAIEAILLIDVEMRGYPLSQTAEWLGLSRKAARNKIAEAREKVRRKLAAPPDA